MILPPLTANCRTKVAPTGLATCLDIGLSNLSLKTVTLTFYSECASILFSSHCSSSIAMCKSSSLIFILGFAFLFRLEMFSWRLVSVILFIAAGVVLMVSGETHFDLGGMILVLSASALGGLRWSLTQLLLRKKEMGLDNPVATMFWLTPIMAFSLAFLCTFVEGYPTIFRSKFFDGLYVAVRTSSLIGAAGFLAFAMVLSEFLYVGSREYCYHA